MTAMRLAAYAPNAESLGPLPAPQDLQASYPLNDSGALSFSYAPEAPRVALLGSPIEVAVEVSHDGGMNWHEPPSSRFMYLRDGRDPLRTESAYAVECLPYIQRLDKALVGFRTLSPDGTRVFEQATPGGILGVLFDEAKNRGALAGMTRSFTSSHDTSGRPWPEAVASIALEPGKTLLSVLQDLAGMGLVDFRTQGRALEMFVADSLVGMGADRTITSVPVVLRAGRDLVEAPFRRTWEALADAAIVHGDNGVNVTRVNPDAVRPWGRQETYATASGITDVGTLSAVGDTVLEGTAQERVEHTFGLDYRSTPHLPFRDYAPGEWVLATTSSADGNVTQRFRVMQVTLTRDTDGKAAGNVVLNDRFLDADVRNARKLDRLLRGASTNGTGGPPTTTPGGNDILAPAKVGALTGASATYVNAEGRNRAQVTLDWGDVTTNADGTSATDVDHYEVWRMALTGGSWAMIGTTTASQFYSSDYEPSSAWKFRVRAVDSVWNRGAFSDEHTMTMAKDTVPPPRPSQPSAASRLGVATVTWNGKAHVNPAGGMGLDYAYTEYHVSATNNTEQDPNLTRIGDTRGEGSAVSGPLAYSTTHYAWVVAVDDNGNRSQASPVRSFAVAALVDVSNFPDDAMEVLYARTAHFITVTSDMIAANQIQAMHIETGAVTAEKLSVFSRKPSVLPNSWMEDTDPVTGRPKYWGTWYSSGAAPSIATITTSPISGTKSMRIGVAADTTFTIGSDVNNWLPVLPGQTWTLRGQIRPALTAIPTGKRVWLRLFTSAPGVNPIGFTGDRTQHSIVLTGPVAAGATIMLEDTFTVPAGHTQAAVAVVAEAQGVSNLFDVDGVELAPGVSTNDVTNIGAGKISTGFIQAGVRIIAGTESGARTEMTAGGFQAYAIDGATKTFEVKSSDGSVFASGTFTTMASSGTGRVQIGSIQNPYQSNQTWNTIQFYSSNSSWSPGMVWSAYGAGSPNWGTLELVSPRLGTRQPARVTLRSEEQTNQTRITVSANEFYAFANNYYWGDGTGGAVSFWLASGMDARYQFMAASGRRIEMRYDTLGQSVLVALADSTTTQELTMRGSALRFISDLAAGMMYMGAATNHANRPILRGTSDWNDCGLIWDANALHVKNLFGSAYRAINASAFTVGSDERLKENIELATDDYLGVVENVPVYAYDLKEAADDDCRHLGLLTRDVGDLLPDAVQSLDADGTQGLDLYHLVATLWGAVQALSAEVRTMKASPTEE